MISERKTNEIVFIVMCVCFLLTIYLVYICTIIYAQLLSVKHFKYMYVVLVSKNSREFLVYKNLQVYQHLVNSLKYSFMTHNRHILQNPLV